jgi:protein TonB
MNGVNGLERPAVTSVERRQWAAGWICSGLLHAVAVAVSLGVMTNLRPVPEQEPFRWEVSLVEPFKQDVPAGPTRMTETTSPLHPAQPHKHPAPVEPVRPSPQPIVRYVETIERQVRHVVTAVQPAEPVVEVQPQEVRSQPVQQTGTVPRELAPVRQIAESTAVQEVKPVQQGTEIQAALSRPIRQIEPVMTESKSPAVEPTRVAQAPVAVQQPELASLVAVATMPTQSAVVVERQPIVEQPAVTPITRNSAPIPDTALAKVEPEPAGRSEEAERVEPEAPAPTVREASSQIAMAPRSAPATNTDYSWLAESLWRRVVELKRYPHEARLNRWEGKVVLKAVIREDGHLGDLQIQKSSGYDILDQDAMELVRKACPLHLKHPLGRPEVVVQIPINYALR